LAKFDVQKLVDVFGRNLGVYFHNASIGVDDDPVEERGEPESVSRVTTLKEDTRNLEVILGEAYRLCDDVHAKLVGLGLLYRSVSIRVVASDLSVYSRSKTFDTPSSSLEQFKGEIKELFEKFLDESDVEARRVGVRLSSLTKREVQQKQITSFFGGN
jgi:nucleotidyltransferase/DNA polymerase involved in DNA repair